MSTLGFGFAPSITYGCESGCGPWQMMDALPWCKGRTVDGPGHEEQQVDCVTQHRPPPYVFTRQICRAWNKKEIGYDPPREFKLMLPIYITMNTAKVCSFVSANEAHSSGRGRTQVANSETDCYLWIPKTINQHAAIPTCLVPEKTMGFGYFCLIGISRIEQFSQR